MNISVQPSFEDYLVSIGAIAPAPAGADARRRPASYRVLLDRSTLEGDSFAAAVQAFHRLPRASMATMRAGKSLADRFSSRFLRDNAVYPYETAQGEYRIAVADPSDAAALRMMDLAVGRTAQREVASYDEIEMLMRDLVEVPENIAGFDGEPIADLSASSDDDDLDHLRDMASGAPVVRTVNELFERAVEVRATDIHIEPFRGALQVRLRVDGLLRQIASPPADMARALVSRVKILASLNIAERRLPQDGRARVRVRGVDLDLRVATMPTAHGEAAILRILERNQRLLDFGRLGLSTRDRTVLERHLEAPHGMIVVTGPTGSGKTTTLASALSHLNSPTRKILTIEDPIEYEVAGVNQSQVKPAIGLTFATALRSFLRQDPDVIMVGEMRDGETAKIGVQASLTGHLVLTTLHTNTAAAAMTRLIDMGVEPFLLASTLRCIIGQRLVRVLCPDCRRMKQVTRADLEREPRWAAVGLKAGDMIGEAVGCDRCAGIGYRGRQGVFEIVELTEQLRDMIGNNAGDEAIERVSRADGMTTMIEDGVAKCRAGTTTIEEVLRVTASR